MSAAQWVNLGVSVLMIGSPIAWLIVFFVVRHRRAKRHEARIAAMREQFAGVTVIDRGAVDSKSSLATVVHSDGKRAHFLLDWGPKP